MSARQRLSDARRVFLDTAPVIYYVEAHPRYLPAAEPVFRRLDDGDLVAVTSPITLAECLILPLRQNNTGLAERFAELLTGGAGILFLPIDSDCAQAAADLRARHGVTLTDALQLAAARMSGCDLFVTNDADLRRTDPLFVLTLDELLAES